MKLWLMHNIYQSLVSKISGMRYIITLFPTYNMSSRSFTQSVLAVVRKIPRGQTLSYQQVAKLAGSPRAYRAVGNILNKNYDPDIPCHRVIRANGSLGGYNRGAKRKKQILQQEKAL